VAELKMFRCDKQNMTLSMLGCAKLWLSTVELRPHPWEGRFNCIACPIGAANAGRPVVATAQSAELLRTVCPRCRQRSARIIQNRLCISCYNRDREVRFGKNAKGSTPTLMLAPIAIAVISPDTIKTVEHPMMTGVTEAMIAAARSATSSIYFGRPGASL
jgi:hypothetical protein